MMHAINSALRAAYPSNLSSRQVRRASHTFCGEELVKMIEEADIRFDCKALFCIFTTRYLTQKWRSSLLTILHSIRYIMPRLSPPFYSRRQHKVSASRKKKPQHRHNTAGFRSTGVVRHHPSVNRRRSYATRLRWCRSLAAVGRSRPFHGRSAVASSRQTFARLQPSAVLRCATPVVSATRGRAFQCNRWSFAQEVGHAYWSLILNAGVSGLPPILFSRHLCSVWPSLTKSR